MYKFDLSLRDKLLQAADMNAVEVVLLMIYARFWFQRVSMALMKSKID